jgi:hypothetical protein
VPDVAAAGTGRRYTLLVSAVVTIGRAAIANICSLIAAVSRQDTG